VESNDLQSSQLSQVHNNNIAFCPKQVGVGFN